MKKVLITGANKGIGFEMAKQLAEKGYYIFIGSRDLQNGLDALKRLKGQGLENIKAIQLDVTDQESVNAASIEIGRSTDYLDILINSAGIGINGIEFNGNM